MSIRINLEIGHEAAIRSKRTIDGFTHDWHVFVTGIDSADIQCYIEKVVFHLHETFPNPKRTIKEPPYLVKESGYAGFNLPIDIYLRNNDEPKKIRFTYDLNLQPTGPAIVKRQKEKYVFNNPSEEFRHKLLKGGGILISSSISDNSRDGISSSNDKQLLNKPKLGSSSESIKKHKVKEHKAEDSFTDLFGTPITKTSKISPDPVATAKSSPSSNNLKPEKSSSSKKSKSKHSPKEKDKEREKEKKEKNPEKRHKEDKKNRERSKDKERKDKSIKRERSPKPQSPSPRRSPKRSSSPPKRAPSPKRPPSPVVKTKNEEKKVEPPPKEKVKSESSKAKREQKEKDQEKKEHKSHKEKDTLNRSSGDQKEHKSNNKEVKSVKDPTPVKQNKEKPNRSEDPPVVKEPEKVEKTKPEKVETVEKVEKIEKTEKTKHKHKKRSDKEKKEEKKEKKEKKSEKKPDKSILFEKMYKDDTPSKESPREVEKVTTPIKTTEPVPEPNVLREKASSRNLNVQKSQFINESSNSSMASHDETSIETPVKVIEKIEQKKSKEKSKGDQSTEKKRKRKHDTNTIKDDPPPKVEEPPVKVVREEPEFNEVQEEKKENVEEEITQDYMSILKDLQHKIMTLQDNTELQKVVQLIAETGHYEITAQTFDFDLCALDRDTVRRLQEFFTVS